jgi:hypothetical protein
MLRVVIDFSKMDTDKRKKKALQVQKEMELILNSTLFKDRVLLMDKRGELSDWKNANNKAIYEYLMDGSETLRPTKDGILNLSIDDYYSFKSVVGYTYENTETVYSNTKYFDSEDKTYENHHRKLTGSNFLHEYGHKKGFDHDFRSTERRDYSICYQMNEIYEYCWNRLIAPTLVKKVEVVSYRSWFRTYTKEIVTLEDSPA